MDRSGYKQTWAWLLATEAVGALSGWLSRDGIKLYTTFVKKPPLSPPKMAFPVAWTVLYALMGIGAARIGMAEHTPERKEALVSYAVQLALNFGWSLVFFQAQAFALAFLWLALLLGCILWMIASFRKVDTTAALLQVPYVLWVCFALYLNGGVWLLNR